MEKSTEQFEENSEESSMHGLICKIFCCKLLRRLSRQMKIWIFLGFLWFLGTVFLAVGMRSMFVSDSGRKTFTVTVSGAFIQENPVINKNDVAKKDGVYWVIGAISIHLSIVFYLIIKLMIICYKNAQLKRESAQSKVIEIPLPTYEDIVSNETPPPLYRKSFKPTRGEYWWTSVLSISSLSSIFGKPPAYSDVACDLNGNTSISLEAARNIDIEGQQCFPKCNRQDKVNSNPCLIYSAKAYSSNSEISPIKSNTINTNSYKDISRSTPVLFPSLKLPKWSSPRKKSFISSLEVVNETASMEDSFEMPIRIKNNTNCTYESSSKKSSSSTTKCSLPDLTTRTLPLKKNRRKSDIMPAIHRENIPEEKSLIEQNNRLPSSQPKCNISNDCIYVAIPEED